MGPSLANLISEEGLVDSVLAGDLNPQAVELLEQNLEHYLKKSTEEINQIRCQDARDWAKDSEHQHSVDLLLVNLPHST